MIAKHEISLTEKKLAGEFRIFVEEYLPRVKARVKSGDAVKSHNRVWSQHEVFTVAALRLVVVIVGQFVVTRHFLVGEDVFRLKVVVVLLFD